MPTLTPKAVAAAKIKMVTMRSDQRTNEGEAAKEDRVMWGSGADNQESCPTLVILLA